MNIYQKLQKCRVELQKCQLKKSGKNSYAGYDYYELGDFLPKINELMMENGLTSVINFNGHATLTIINMEKPEETITFESPTADAQLKGCHPVQNLGAVQTYLRRYLYTNAFEIVEHDALDATIGKPEKPEQKQPQQPKPQQQPKSPDEPSTLDKLKSMLWEMSGKNKDKTLDLLEEYTTFQGKDGSQVKGRRSFDGMSDKQINATYGKVKKDYESQEAKAS